MMYTNSNQNTAISSPGRPIAPRISRLAQPKRLKTIVLAARGADSLSPVQRLILEQTSQVKYVCILSPLSIPEFTRLVFDFEYIAITRRAIDRLDRPVIDALPNLKGISVYSTGVEWMDTDYLQIIGIRWTALPDYCTNAVAESALGLMLMVAHKLHLRYLKSTRNIPDSVGLCGFELSNSVVGIIGHGKIGKCLAKKLKVLCKQVLVHDKDPKVLSTVKSPLRTEDKTALLRKSRFVVICASQQYREQQILSDADYALLRPDTVVVNVARTSLLDHERLISMVKRRQIRAYVYDDLMRKDDDPNADEYGKIIPTGHTAWYTAEAIQNGTQAWVDNLISLCLTAY